MQKRITLSLQIITFQYEMNKAITLQKTAVLAGKIGLWLDHCLRPSFGLTITFCNTGTSLRVGEGLEARVLEIK